MTIVKLKRGEAKQKLVTEEFKQGIAGAERAYHSTQRWEEMPDKLLVIYWQNWFNEELEITD